MEFARIEAGSFLMGTNALPEDTPDWFELGLAIGINRESPQHHVTLTKPFYMGVTEVTQGQFKAVMGTAPWKGKREAREWGRANFAANYISWDDATAFCAALSKRTGRTVRLPTEAEWEYACRAGTTTFYSFGDDLSDLNDHAWNIDNVGSARHYAHRVAAKKPNAWGLYDMHGNVAEWCADWWADSYANAEARDPKGPATGERRVMRGGGWSYGPGGTRAAYRQWWPPDEWGSTTGFRLIVEAIANKTS